MKGLLKNLEDYSIDQRGDVGSWIREESMKTLGLVVPLVTRLDIEISDDLIYLALETQVQILGKLLKQASERIDRTRACAGSTLSEILKSTNSHGEPLFNVPGQQALLSITNRSVCWCVGQWESIPGIHMLKLYNFFLGSELDWTSPADVYHLLVPLLAISEYRYELLTGLVTSAGSRTESLVSYVRYLTNAPDKAE